MKCKITFPIQILGSWDSWPDRAWGSVWPSGHSGCHSPIYLWDIQARIISYFKLAFLVCPISTSLYQVTQDSLPSAFCFLNAGILMVGCVMFLSIHYIKVKYKLSKTWIIYILQCTYICKTMQWMFDLCPSFRWCFSGDFCQALVPNPLVPNPPRTNSNPVQPGSTQLNPRGLGMTLKSCRPNKKVLEPGFFFSSTFRNLYSLI